MMEGTGSAATLYPLFLILGASAGCGLTLALMRRRGVALAPAAIIVAGTAVAGLAGAKGFSVLERGGFVSWSLAWELRNGYRYPGGLALALLWLWWSRRLLLPQVRVSRLADFQAPGIALAMVIVRVGCLVAGCCHGLPSELPWALRYPAGSDAWTAHVERSWVDPSATMSLAVHPLPAYFVLASAITLAAVLWLRRRQRYSGQVFFAFLALSGAAKFLLEFLRLDYRASLHYAALTVSLVGMTALVVRAGRVHTGDFARPMRPATR